VSIALLHWDSVSSVDAITAGCSQQPSSNWGKVCKRGPRIEKY
jgi:hypothetical protein